MTESNSTIPLAGSVSSLGSHSFPMKKNIGMCVGGEGREGGGKRVEWGEEEGGE